VGLAVGGPRLQTAFGLFLVVFGIAFALSQLGAPAWASDAALFASVAIGVAAVVFGDLIARFRPGRPPGPAIGRAEDPASTLGQ